MAMDSQLQELEDLDVSELQEATIVCPLRKKAHLRGHIAKEAQGVRVMAKRKRTPQVQLSLAEISEMQSILKQRYYNVKEVAAYFNLSVAQTNRYLGIYKKSGGRLLDYFVAMRRRNPKRDPQALARRYKGMGQALSEMIGRAPKLYQRQMVHLLREEYGIAAPQTAVSRCLRALRVVKKKPEKMYIETNTESNLRHRQQYCEIYLQLQNKCMFLDECGINNRIRREKGWIRRGEKFHCEQPADGTNKYSLLAAISFERLLESQLKVGAFAALDMVQFICQRLGDKYSDYVLILDNARIHKTPQVREALAQCNIRYLYLPPYSPVLNPIECVFHQFKGAIRDIRSENPDDSLKSAIEAALARISRRSFANYQRRVRMWAEKGLAMEKF